MMSRNTSQRAPSALSLSDYPNEVCIFQVIPGCNKKCGFCYNTPHIKNYQFDPEYVFNEISKNLNDVDAIMFGGGEPLSRNFDLLLDLVNKIRKQKENIKIGVQTASFHPDSREKIKDLDPNFVSFTVNSGRKQDISAFNNQKKDSWETKLIYIPGEAHKFLKYSIDVVQQFIPGECLDPEYNKIKQPSRDEVMKFAKKIGADEIITKENGREKV